VSGNVSTTWIPRDIRDTVMITRTKQSHIRTRLGIAFQGVIIRSEVEIPELDIVLGRAADGGKCDVSSLG
jgi:hypothetical protein